MWRAAERFRTEVLNRKDNIKSALSPNLPRFFVIPIIIGNFVAKRNQLWKKR